MSRPMIVLMALAALLGSPAGAPAARADAVGDLLADLAAGRDAAAASVPDLLWEMSLDDGFGRAVLARVSAEHLALADTLLSTLRLPEPALRRQLPALRELRDDPTPEEQLVPAWRDVRFNGVRLLRAVVQFGGRPRDRRLQRDVDEALARMPRPQNAALAGIVDLYVQWWAERGDDPSLTHDPARILDLDPYLARLDLPEDDPQVWKGLDLLTDLDADPVLRERLLRRLDPTRHRHLCAEMVEVLGVGPDSLVALGVEPRRWDAATGSVRGHAALDLHRLAHEVLDRVSGYDTNDDDDLQRRLQRLLWWRAARYEARHWRDPRQAPSFARFLDGLDRTEAEGGTPIATWLRSVYLEDTLTRSRILERLGERQSPAVADLIEVLGLTRSEAIARGFRLTYLRRDLTLGPSQRQQRIAIDWDDMKAIARRALAAITGEDPYLLVPSDDPDLQDAAWQEWWSLHRSEPRWYRSPDDAAEPSDRPPRFETERGRID